MGKGGRIAEGGGIAEKERGGGSRDRQYADCLAAIVREVSSETSSEVRLCVVAIASPFHTILGMVLRFG